MNLFCVLFSDRNPPSCRVHEDQCASTWCAAGHMPPDWLYFVRAWGGKKTQVKIVSVK